MNAEIFFNRLTGLQIPLTKKAAQSLFLYHQMLVDYNSRMDLTAVTDEDEILNRHYADSLMPLTIPGLIPHGASVIDVGTGAGFPGLPLAIARPDLTVTLLDSQKKRMAFLSDVLGRIAIPNAQCLPLRAEDAAAHPLYRETFDLATARAVAGLSTLLEYTLPFVKPGGKALYWKGPQVLKELSGGTHVAHLLGGRLLQPQALADCGQDWQHLLLPCEKLSPTLRQYPRRNGIPHKRPLRINIK